MMNVDRLKLALWNDVHQKMLPLSYEIAMCVADKIDPSGEHYSRILREFRLLVDLREGL